MHLILILLLSSLVQADYVYNNKDGHDDPIEVIETDDISGRIAKHDLVQCQERQSTGAGKHVRNWAIFFICVLVLVLVMIAAVIAYKRFTQKSKSVFERLYPGMTPQQPNQALTTGRHTMIQFE